MQKICNTAWSQRLLACGFLDIFWRYGKTTTLSTSRALYDEAVTHRDSFDPMGDGWAPETAEGCSGSSSSSSSSGVYCLPLPPLSSVHHRFLQKSRNTVEEYLRERGVRIQHHNRSLVMVWVHASLKAGHATGGPNRFDNGALSPRLALGAAEVKTLLQEVETTFESRQPDVNYGELIATVTRACAHAVAFELIPDVFHGTVNEELIAERLKFVPNALFGGDMVGYDLCFETDGSNNRVSFPDFNKLTAQHHNHFFRLPTMAPFKNRKHFTYILEALTIPSHEVIHLFQSWAQQRDTSPMSWVAEHDASVPSLSLLYHIGANVGPMDDSGAVLSDPTGSRRAAFDLLQGGVLELCVMYCQLIDTEMVLSLLTPHEMGEYVKHRDSFGLHVPEGVDHENIGLLEHAFKELLPYEWFVDCPERLALLLRALFEGRFDVDTATTPPPVVPERLKSPSSWFFQRPGTVETMLETLREFADEEQ